MEASGSYLRGQVSPTARIAREISAGAKENDARIDVNEWLGRFASGLHNKPRLGGNCRDAIPATASRCVRTTITRDGFL